MKTISNRIIRKLKPCYDPSEVVKNENEELPVKEWVAKYRNLVRNKSDIIWLLCNKLYMSERDMRLFAVWCAREALRLVDNPDERSVEACNVAERYAKGEASEEELEAAAMAAKAVVWDVWAVASATSDALAAASDVLAAALASSSAASTAAALTASATSSSDRDAQIDQLITYF